MDYEIPFYGNTPDNTHCFQAALKMIFKHFWPDRDYSWEELEKITAKKEGLWTWPMAGLVWMSTQNVEIKNIEVFDYERFIQDGSKYLVDEFGQEVADIQIAHSDIEQEQRLSAEFLKRVKVTKTIPTIEDIKKLLMNGYVLICPINSRQLNQKPGYSGHTVVVKGFDDSSLTINDPGLPPLENRKVSFDEFERAWAYPNDRAKNIMAFKLNN